jgi:hypothetical protein
MDETRLGAAYGSVLTQWWYDVGSRYRARVW